MKKTLLILFSLFMATHLGAQLMHPSLSSLVDPVPREMTLGDAARGGSVRATTPVRSGEYKPFYRRPAGAFHSMMVTKNGVGGYYLVDGQVFGHSVVFFKPHSDYTFDWTTGGDAFLANSMFTVFHHEDSVGYSNSGGVKVRYDLSEQPMPALYVGTGGFSTSWARYQMRDIIDGNVMPARAVAQPYFSALDPDKYAGVELLLSSKTMTLGGRDGNVEYLFASYSGAEPYGDNSQGWWFGKNNHTADGIAQAFEKPEHPYLLSKVAIFLNDYDLKVNKPVEVNCKVYRMSEIPEYRDDSQVYLTDEIGELVATGYATLSQQTATVNQGLLTFDLYEGDGEGRRAFTPTVDYPILVVFEGYNDIDDIVDFTAFVSNDDQVDEGYGELAYIKLKYLNEDGDAFYGWTGLNRLFGVNTIMMTGLSIFIIAEHPYIANRYREDDGQYAFDAQGGLMTQQIVTDSATYTTRSIEFLTSQPSFDKWDITWNGIAPLPSWLNISLELSDVVGGDCVVTASVTAEPLPSGMTYREATVRFAIPGDYEYYKFIQTADGSVTPSWHFMVDGIFYKQVGPTEAYVVSPFETYGTEPYGRYLVIPQQVTHLGETYDVTGIAEGAFEGCDRLQHIAIPVSVKQIGCAFDGCDVQGVSLTGNGPWMAGALPATVRTLYIGSGVTSVPGMKVAPNTIFAYPVTPPACDDASFTSYAGTLRVPTQSMAAYFSAAYWSNFASTVGSAIEPTSLTLSQTDVMLDINDKTTITATVTPNNAKPKAVTWYSSDPNVASVSTSGVVTAVGFGQCDIYAICVGLQAVCHVRVTDARVELDKHELTIAPNTIATITASLTGQDAGQVTLTATSSDASVVLTRVLENRLVQVIGLKPGQATVTVGSWNNDIFTDSCVVTVSGGQPGDVNGDGVVEISDLTDLIDYLLSGDAQAIDLTLADVDGDGDITIGDVSVLIDTLLTRESRATR